MRKSGELRGCMGTLEPACVNMALEIIENAISAAFRDPRFVPVKTPDQQSVMMLHRVRLMLNRQRTQLSNAMRAHMAEFGVVAPVGRMGLERLLAIVDDHEDRRIPLDARVCLAMLAAQLAVVKKQVLENDRRIRESARETVSSAGTPPSTVASAASRAR